MRTSFHHQPEAQHPKSSAIHKLVGRLPHLSTRSRPNRGLLGTSVSGRNGLSQSSKLIVYSITSSARASNMGGTVRPSALAVLSLMANANAIGCWTGRSAALASLRTRSLLGGMSPVADAMSINTRIRRLPNAPRKSSSSADVRNRQMPPRG
jgi:hypothetical protein